MSAAPADLYYSAAHVWLQLEDNNVGRVGVTEFAQEALGDVVFLQLPELGQVVGAGAEAGVVESVKSASDIFMPVTGEIVEVNEALRTTPELINSSPYDKGWIFRIRIGNKGELSELMDAGKYLALCSH